MQEKWNQFVYDLCEAKRKNVGEHEYHSIIETRFELLGWIKYKEEICHKPNIPIGNNSSIQPDILIKKDGEEQFVIEVKRPVHAQKGRERQQLQSYMRQLKLAIGIYIGEHIEVYYDKKTIIPVLKIDLELDAKSGARFVELFSKDRFSKDVAVKFCEERILEMRKQESLNKIRENLMGEEGHAQIAESMRSYLTEKYNNVFTERDISEMLSSLTFKAVPKEESSLSIVPKKRRPRKDSRQIQKVVLPSGADAVPCMLLRNGINAKGIFNKSDYSLVLLKGCTISSKNLPNLKPAEVERRKRGIADYTEERNGILYVKQDIRFKTPSGAAVFCIGGSANGWKEWIDENKNPLDRYRTKHT